MQLADPSDLWINIVGPMEGSDARNHAAAGSSRTVPPLLRQSRLKAEKAGVAMLFSGVFLTMVGVAFTTIGLKDFQKHFSLEWTRLMGPVLISLGITCILTSIHKFGIFSFLPCRRQREEEGEEEDEEEVYVIPLREQNSHQRPSFLFHGINQSVMLQGTTTMLCIPPAYNLQQAVEFQPGVSVSAVHSALPSYDSVCRVGNNVAEEGGSGSGSHSDHRGRSVQKTEEERRSSVDSSRSHPPAYEEIYPHSHKRHSH